MKTFKNFIFDWSGTLVDDLGPVLDSTNKVFNHFGKPSFTREQFCSDSLKNFVYSNSYSGIDMSGKNLS